MIHRALTLNTAPEAEPFTTAELKDWCRISTSAEDAQIARLAKGCRRTIENMLGISLIDTIWDEYWDCFPCEISPYRSPVSAIELFEYVDTAGNTQELTAGTHYQSDLVSKPARIKPAYGTVWPSTRNQYNAVHLRYTAGFGDEATDIPEDIRDLFLLLFALAYEERLPLIMGGSGEEVPVPAGFRQKIANNTIWGF